MPTVIHELADAFLRRKQALAERGQAKTKLAGSDYFMPKSAKEDLNNRLSVFEQGGLPELLKQGASEMYHNPIVNTAISLTPGAGDVQSGYEAVQSAKEGKWGEAGLNALGVLPFIPSMGMIGKTVWHGSPHSFDKFDLSKIGTGEGAQAYGHGLYLADAPETAKSYSGKLSSELSYNGKPMNRESAKNTKDSAAWALYLAEGDKEAAKASGLAKPELIDKLDYSKLQPGGQLYKVDLPDEQIAKMLDWDKPLSEQPQAVQEGLKNALVNRGISQSVADYIVSNKSGQEGLATLARGSYDARLNVPEGKQSAEASRMLYEAGIPGIQYLDQASRGAGEGTRNYVVFSDEIPKILERNGTSVFEFPKD